MASAQNAKSIGKKVRLFGPEHSRHQRGRALRRTKPGCQTTGNPGSRVPSRRRASHNSMRADPGTFAAALCIDLADVANFSAMACTCLPVFARLRQCSQAFAWYRFLRARGPAPAQDIHGRNPAPHKRIPATDPGQLRPSRTGQGMVKLISTIWLDLSRSQFGRDMASWPARRQLTGYSHGVRLTAPQTVHRTAHLQLGQGRLHVKVVNGLQMG
jgi:hypothetical protein